MSPLIGSTDFTVNKSAFFVSTISSVLRRRVAVYQRSHWRRCRGSSTETGEWPQPCGPLDTKHLLRLRTFWTSYWDPHTLSITDHFTNNRKAQPSEARFLLLLPTSAWRVSKSRQLLLHHTNLGSGNATWTTPQLPSYIVRQTFAPRPLGLGITSVCRRDACSSYQML